MDAKNIDFISREFVYVGTVQNGFCTPI